MPEIVPKLLSPTPHLSFQTSPSQREKSSQANSWHARGVAEQLLSFPQIAHPCEAFLIHRNRNVIAQHGVSSYAFKKPRTASAARGPSYTQSDVHYSSSVRHPPNLITLNQLRCPL